MREVEWGRYPCVARCPAARAFIESCARRQQRPKTLDAYARNLEDLFQAFATIAPERVVEADAGDFDRYLDLLSSRAPRRRGRENIVYMSGRQLSDNTIRQRVVTARLFYDFCIRRGLRADMLNPVPRGHRGGDGAPPVRGPVPHGHRLPWVPPDDIWERIIRHTLAHESRRNAAMILLAYGCALRREELVSLRLDDVDWAQRLVRVRAETSKSGRPRLVPFSPFVELVLRRYVQMDRRPILDAFGGDPDGPLFISESQRNPGRPLRIGAFNDIIEKLRQALGVPQFTPHTLRHQRCTMLKRGGMDLDDIALFAGHASIATTRLYIHLAPAELSARVRAATARYDDHVLRLIEEARHADADL